MLPNKCFSWYCKGTLAIAVTFGAIGGAACSVYIYRKCHILLRELKSAAEKSAKSRNEPLQQQAPDGRESQAPDERELSLQSKGEPHNRSCQNAPRPGFAGLAQTCAPPQQHYTLAQTATTAPVPKRRSAEQNENADAKIFLAALFRHHPYFYHYTDRYKQSIPPLLPAEPAATVMNPQLTQQEEQQGQQGQTSSPSSAPAVIEEKEQQQQQQQQQQNPQPGSSSQQDSPARSRASLSQQDIQSPQLLLQKPEGPSQSQPQRQQPGGPQTPPQFQWFEPQLHGLTLPEPAAEGHEMSAPEINPLGRRYDYQHAPLSPYHQHPQHFPIGFGRIQMAQAQTATIAPVARVAIVNAAAPVNACAASTIGARAQPVGARARPQRNGHIPAGGSDRQLHRATRHRPRRLTGGADSSDSMASHNSVRSRLRSCRHLYFHHGRRQLQIQSMRHRTAAAALHGSQRQLLQLQQHLEAQLQVQQLLLSREGSQDKLYRERECRRRTTADPSRDHGCLDIDISEQRRPVQLRPVHYSSARARQQQQDKPPLRQQAPFTVALPQQQNENSQGSDDELTKSPFMLVQQKQRPQELITHQLKRSVCETTTLAASLSHRISGAVTIHTNDLYVTPTMEGHTELVAEHRPAADAVDGANFACGCLLARPRDLNPQQGPITTPTRRRPDDHRQHQIGKSPNTPNSHSGDDCDSIATRAYQPPRPTRKVIILKPPDLAYVAASAFVVAAAAAVKAAVAAATAVAMRDITGDSGDGASPGTSGSATPSSCPQAPCLVLPSGDLKLRHHSPSPIRSFEADEPQVLTPPTAVSRPLAAVTQNAHAIGANTIGAANDYSATASGGASAAAASLIEPPSLTTVLRCQASPPRAPKEGLLLGRLDPGWSPSPPAYQQQTPLPERTWAAAATAAAAIAVDDSDESYSPVPGSSTPPPAGIQGRNPLAVMMPYDTHLVASFGRDPWVSGVDGAPPNTVTEQRNRLEPVLCSTVASLRGSFPGGPVMTPGCDVVTVIDPTGYAFAGSSPPNDVGEMFWQKGDGDTSPLYNLNNATRCATRAGLDGVTRNTDGRGASGASDAAVSAADVTPSAVAVTADGDRSGMPYNEHNMNTKGDVAAAPADVDGGVARVADVATVMATVTVTGAGDRGGAVGLAIPSTPPTPLQMAVAAAVTSHSVGMASAIHGSFSAAAVGSSPFVSKHTNGRTTVAVSPQPRTQTPPADRAAATAGHVAPPPPQATVEALAPGLAPWDNAPSKAVSKEHVAGASMPTAYGVRRSVERDDGTREAMTDTAPVSISGLTPRIISPRSVLSRSTAAAAAAAGVEREASAKAGNAVFGSMVADSPARVRPSRTVLQPRSPHGVLSGCTSVRSSLAAQALLCNSLKKGSATAASVAATLSPCSPPRPLPPSLTTGGMVLTAASQPSKSSTGLSTQSDSSKSLALGRRDLAASQSATPCTVSASGSIASSTAAKERTCKPAWVNPASPARPSRPAREAAAAGVEHRAQNSTPRSRLLALYVDQEATATSDLGRGHGHGRSSCATGGCSVPSFMNPTAASRAKTRPPVPSRAGTLRSKNADLIR
ncbi:hypothetical protein Vretifemale_20599 [Volvox reticuliferus]|uniref:Uncharacterized protein n=1 Tax=Volvox reticuliferus TaxID=1737510 RepID=A0A8J4G1S7_9CHLO|nr:hypothetical protein Vretifemale_20599 [Volvox reticuliferus]